MLIADDHEAIRLQTRDILAGAGFDVVVMANDGLSAVKGAIEHQPAVCLLDINMPGDGIEAAREINRVVPTSTVVMLTVSREEAHLFDALRAGARGYLLKGTDPSEMVAQLNNVLDGEPALSPGLAMRIIEQFRGDRSRRVYVRDRQAVELSPREAEVLDLMRQGLRTDQIARRMYVAPVTVRTHVRSVLKKLNATDRNAALKMFDNPPES